MKYFIIGLVLLVIILSIYTVIIYNKLKSEKNEVDKLWNQLRLAIQEQFNLVNNNINLIKDINIRSSLKELIDNYYKSDYLERVMDYYLTLESIINNLKDNELKNTFISKNKDIKEIKTKYNNIVLKYNNTVSMFSSFIIAKIFKFNPGIWFRNN